MIRATLSVGSIAQTGPRLLRPSKEPMRITHGLPSQRKKVRRPTPIGIPICAFTVVRVAKEVSKPFARKMVGVQVITV